MLYSLQLILFLTGRPAWSETYTRQNVFIARLRKQAIVIIKISATGNFNKAILLTERYFAAYKKVSCGAFLFNRTQFPIE